MAGRTAAVTLVLDAVGLVDDWDAAEARRQIATDQATRLAALDELFVLTTAVYDTGGDFGDLAAWADHPAKEFVAHVLSCDGSGMDAERPAARNAMLLHERIGVQVDLVEAFAQAAAATLGTVVGEDDADEFRSALGQLATIVEIANETLPQPGRSAAAPWAPKLEFLPLPRRRALAAVASLADRRSVGSETVAVVLDLLYGPLLDDDVLTAELVDALAELATVAAVPTVFRSPQSRHQSLAVALADLNADDPPEMWWLRDQALGAAELDDVIELLVAQTRLAVAAVLSTALLNERSVDDVLLEAVSVWEASGDSVPLPPRLSDPPPPRWSADDGFGSGAVGRALRMVAADAAGDAERCVHLLRPLAASPRDTAEFLDALASVGARFLVAVDVDAEVDVDDTQPPALVAAARMVNAACAGDATAVTSAGLEFVDSDWGRVVSLARALSLTATALVSAAAEHRGTTVDGLLVDVAQNWGR
jgi:hypothetical protein